MPNFLLALAVLALVLVSSTSCATRKFVRTDIGEVSDKVDSLSTALEQTQERVQKNEAQIREVDQEAEAALKAAQEAQEAAAAAAKLAKAVDAETDAIEKATRKIVYEVVVTEQEGGFRFESAELPDAVKKELDQLVAKLKAEPRNVLITIEGYTDSTGPRAVNERLGLERAKAVQEYLYGQHQIPLHKMEVISYGEEDPVAPNRTRAGRAQNRRVEIKVLA